MIKYPTNAEVQEQLKMDFGKLPVEISAEEIQDLSTTVSEIFSKMENKPYEGFSIYTQEQPCVCLHRWQSEQILRNRKLYSADYSSIDQAEKTYSHLTIHIVVAWGVKRIELHFVSQINDEEKNELCANIDEIMGRMNIEPNSQSYIKEMIMQRATATV